jgi:outer membrane biosynthesis protein TonB
MGTFDHRLAAMDVRQYIRSDLAVSALVHLSLVACVIIYTEVRPFRPVVEKTVPVDVIVADEKTPEPLPSATPSPSPSPDLSLLTKPQPVASPSPAAPPPAASQPPQPQQQPPSPSRRDASSPPKQAPAQPAPAPQAQQQAATPGYTVPEPDLTIKYHVMLGLPESIPVSPVSAGAKRGEGGDTSPASDNLVSSLVDAFRRHLKTCSKLPASLSPSDTVAVKLRVPMTPDGRLAAEPALIEGTASLKGVELMRGAVAALAACQPYAMLPVDRYGEWKVLELSFTPRDFNS